MDDIILNILTVNVDIILYSDYYVFTRIDNRFVYNFYVCTAPAFVTQRESVAITRRPAIVVTGNRPGNEFIGNKRKNKSRNDNTKTDFFVSRLLRTRDV